VARSCQVCGKGFSIGNQVTTRGKAKYLGGVGTKVTGITRRKFKPNLQRLRVTVGNGTSTTVLVCTQCIKSGKVTKLVKRKPFHLPKVEKAKPVAEITPAIQKLVDDMAETMYAAPGVGLAAPQIGVAKRIFVIDIAGADEKSELRVFINPEFVAREGDTSYEEGCLSFPGIRGDVLRPDAIRVTFQDERGTPHQLSCDGLLARCIQHEVDHLNGVLFIERMEKKSRAGIDDAVKTLAKETKAAGRQ